MGCCCCLPLPPESSRTTDDHVPLSRAPSSSALPTGAVNIYTAPLQPPLPVTFSPKNPSKFPTTQSNSSQGALPITKHTVPEKETSLSVGDQSDINLKKKDQETIDECPICLEEYEPENPRLLTKCRHDFHLACILEWMERSEACPLCDKELVLPES